MNSTGPRWPCAFGFLSALLALLPALTACGGGGTAEPATNAPPVISIQPPNDLVALPKPYANGEQPVSYRQLDASGFGGMQTPRAVAVNDEASWAALWAEGNAYFPPRPRPSVDFNTQTVAAVSTGAMTPCNDYTLQIDGVAFLPSTNSFRVYYQSDIRPGPPDRVCAAVSVTAAQIVRFDNPQHLPVEFIAGAQAPASKPLPFTVVETSDFSAIQSWRTASVDNQVEWAALWAEHTANMVGARPLPGVDFGTQGVAAIFSWPTWAPYPCPVLEIASVDVLTDADVVRVGYRQRSAGDDVMCAAVVTTPARIVRFDNPTRRRIVFVPAS